MNIVIKSIPHSEQRYETCGDYWEDPDGTIQFRVDKMKDWRYEWLVIIHELIEKALCKQAGIKDTDIDAFDKNYEANRTNGDDSEPGDAPDAPYRKQHLFATGVEKCLAAELDVDWATYDAVVMAGGDE